MAFTTTVVDHAGSVPMSPSFALSLLLGLTNSYPAGGYDFDPDELWIEHLGCDKAPSDLGVIFEQPAGYELRFNRATSKVKVFGAAAANMSLTSAGLAIGSGSKKKVLITNTVTFLIAGLFKSKTTAEVAFTATTHDIAPHATLVQEAVYTVSLQADGTPVLTMGTISSGSGTALIPAAPAGEAVIGYVRIAVAAGATPFDASSDDLDAAHITDTYVNAALIPSGAYPAATEVATGTDVSGVTTARAILLAQ